MTNPTAAVSYSDACRSPPLAMAAGECCPTVDLPVATAIHATERRFTMDKPPVIDVEVVSETAGSRDKRAHPGGPRPPVHPLAALILLVVDNLWNLADWAVVTWAVTIPAAFLSVFVPTLILHRRSLGQPPARALGWATLLGMIAAVPFSVGGTALGAALLAWLGIQRLGHKPQA